VLLLGAAVMALQTPIERTSADLLFKYKRTSSLYGAVIESAEMPIPSARRISAPSDSVGMWMWTASVFSKANTVLKKRETGADSRGYPVTANTFVAALISLKRYCSASSFGEI
jgi:hypothetical protein